MKKRLIYICMFASLLTFSSCNEALDVAPDGRLSLDEVFQDPDLTKAYFSTCFDYLPKKSLRYHFWSNYPVALSDEAWDCGSVVILGGLSLVNSLHAYTFASLKRKKLISTTPLNDALNALILALNASAAAFVLLFTKKFRILS